MSVIMRTRVIGTTRILDPLGEGGMARVYRGVQETLQRQVAVKVMLPAISKKKDMVTRFRREALALAQLEHENIVAVYDLVEKNKQIFIIMEFVEGVDLGTLIEEGPLPLDATLLVCAGVARALEHAHFRRIIHRDIKPANVMLSRTGQIKLMDFGVAKDLDIDDLTRTGMVIGTPSYLAPEVLKGERPDHRSDIYALGVVLFQCLTGEKPYRATNRVDLFRAIAAGDRVKLRSVIANAPRPIERIIDRCLDVEPDRRFRSAAEARWHLERHLGRMLDGALPQKRVLLFLRARGHATADDLLAVAMDDRTHYESSPSLGDSLSEGAQRKARGSSSETTRAAARRAKASASPDGRTLAARVGRPLAMVLFFAGVIAFCGAVAWVIAPEQTESLLEQVVSWARQLG